MSELGTFNQEKAIVGTFSVIVQLQTSRRFVLSSTAGRAGGPRAAAGGGPAGAAGRPRQRRRRQHRHGAGGGNMSA